MTTENKYLRTIYLLQQSGGDAVSTGDVADALDVAPASANEMIGKLEERGLVEHEKYEGATLTEAGVERGRSALETYCIVERFLVSVLEVESFRAEAGQLESVVDETVADRLDMIVDRRPECPECFAPEEDKCAFLDAPGD